MEEKILSIKRDGFETFDIIKPQFRAISQSFDDVFIKKVYFLYSNIKTPNFKQTLEKVHQLIHQKN